MDIDKDERFKKEILNLEGKNIELEAKFKKPFNEKTLDNFYNMMNFSDYTIKDSLIVDYFLSGDKRISFIEDEYYDTSKEDIFSDIFFADNIKVSVKTENKIKTREPRGFKFYRKKERKSFVKNNLSLDITKVTSSSNEGITWEIELEVINFDLFNYNDFITAVLFYNKTIFTTAEEIIVFYNNIFTSKIQKNMGTYISKPRDLQIVDLKNNGLGDNYTVSPKADGEMYFLIYHQSGIWLISSKHQKKIGINYTDKICIYAGELLNPENMKPREILNSKHLFLFFDCIKYGDKNLKDENYMERLKYFEEDIIKDKQGLNILEVRKKIVLVLNDDYFLNMNKIFEILIDTDYKTDGVIFTPIYSPYIAPGQNILKNRTLSNCKDVCKYKQILSIDFYYKNGKLYSYSNGGLIEFNGTNKYPFTSKNFSIKYPSKYNFKILELSPEETPEGVVYKFTRIRTDKEFPNNIKVASTLWNLVHNPITIDTITGKNITLLRKYNNQIKKKLISKIKGYVIDIGSGNGGDLLKYQENNDINKILSVEPNETFVEEFKKRLSSLPNKNKIMIPLNCGGEESDKISDYIKNNLPVNKDDDVNIIFMLSLSFFWKNKNFYDKLVETLEVIFKESESNGIFNIYYYTIMGNRVKRLFEEKGNTIKLNTISLKKIDDSKYYVDIEDSVTVFKQTEYYVDIDQLAKSLNGEFIFRNNAIGGEPDDYILTDNEKTYNSLFEYGCIQIKKENLKKIILPVEHLNENDESIQLLHAIGLNIYRIKSSTNNIYFPILYLVSDKFRLADPEKKLKYLDKFKERVFATNNFYNIAEHINSDIYIYNKYGIYKKFEKLENTTHIKLYQTGEKYESIVKIVNEDIQFIFN